MWDCFSFYEAAFLDFLKSCLIYLNFFLVPVLCWNSQLSSRDLVKMEKIPVFFFMCFWFFFSALYFARKQSRNEGFYTVAFVRWYSFLCWEKSILPESIVKRFNIIRQLVVWLKETPCTWNSHSSLFFRRKTEFPRNMNTLKTKTY